MLGVEALVAALRLLEERRVPGPLDKGLQAEPPRASLTTAAVVALVKQAMMASTHWPAQAVTEYRAASTERLPITAVVVVVLQTMAETKGLAVLVVVAQAAAARQQPEQPEPPIQAAVAVVDTTQWAESADQESSSSVIRS